MDDRVSKIINFKILIASYSKIYYLLIFRNVNKVREKNIYQKDKIQQWEMDPRTYYISSMREWKDMLIWTQQPHLNCEVGEIDLTFGNLVPKKAESSSSSSSSSPAVSTPTNPAKLVFETGDFLPDNLFGNFLLYLYILLLHRS